MALIISLAIFIGTIFGVIQISNSRGQTGQSITGPTGENILSATGPTGLSGAFGSRGSRGPVGPTGIVAAPVLSIDTTTALQFITSDGYSQSRPCTMYVAGTLRIVTASFSLPHSLNTGVLLMYFNPPGPQSNYPSYNGCSAYIGRYSGINFTSGLQLTLSGTRDVPDDGINFRFSFVGGNATPHDLSPSDFTLSGASIEILLVIPNF